MTTVTKEVAPRFEDYIFDWDQERYLLVGGYGSSKSYNTAVKLLLKAISEKRKILVIREVFDTHRESTFSLLTEVAYELGIGERARITASPMKITLPNGSEFIFRGMDNPQKLKSINNVSIIWVEECSEVKYEGFKELLGRLRHPDLSTHMLLTTNPVSTQNWVYTHFFKDELNGRFVLDDKDLYEQKTIVHNGVYYHHSTVQDNPFMPPSYRKNLDDLKNSDMDLWRIAWKGHFGLTGKKVLPRFESAPHAEVMRMIGEIKGRPLYKAGMDFGFEESFNALVRMVVDQKEQILYIYWEYYKRGITDDVMLEDLKPHRREIRETIKADSAEPKTIEYMRRHGWTITKAKKFQGSRLQYTKKVRRFKKIICSDQCKNTIRELANLTYKVDKDGRTIEDEFNIDPHTLSAIWYGLDDYDPLDLKNHAMIGRR